jgi:hypothetical protein
VRTSAELERDNLPPLTLGELMRFIGMRLLMSMLQVWLMDEYWHYDPVPRPQEEGPCPYNFKEYMSKKRFQAIIKCLTFTDAIPPAYRDKFWQVRQMIRAWNENMASVFVAAWVMS